MALFFDQDWFNQQLKSIARTHEDVAALLQLSSMQVAEIWKDQRELLPHEVGALAKFLNATPAEVADHAGVSTPVPGELDDADLASVVTRLDEMNGRLDRIERALVDLKSLVLEQSATKSKEV
tara:strand:+ start:179 stop:547 length:369 start_codon:yes stop_codon:yes gene_type:complete